MVNITIYVEGGVLPHPNIDAMTMDNSVALRQSLNRIFHEVLDKEVQIKVLLKSGRLAAYKQFASEINESLFLFLDSDCPPSKLGSWFENFEEKENEQRIRHGDNPDFQVPEEQREKIFFMIQEMESWILKDFSSITRWAEKKELTRLRVAEDMSQHTLVRRNNVEEITKPSEKLKSLLKLFFQKKDGGDLKYGKLRTAPDMLDCVDVSILLSKDSELKRFASIFN